MTDIYKLAERVAVWLGPASVDSSLALRTLYKIRSKIRVD
jgi:hypothetical protein